MSAEFAAERTARATHLAVLEQQTVTLLSVEKGITRLGGGFETMQTAIETLSSASATNHSETHAILSQIL